MIILIENYKEVIYNVVNGGITGYLPITDITTQTASRTTDTGIDGLDTIPPATDGSNSSSNSISQ